MAKKTLIALATAWGPKHGGIASFNADFAGGGGRDVVFTAALAARPERFPGGQPSAGVVPNEVWVNEPQRLSSVEETTRR